MTHRPHLCAGLQVLGSGTHPLQLAGGALHPLHGWHPRPPQPAGSPHRSTHPSRPSRPEGALPSQVCLATSPFYPLELSL